MPDVKDFAPNNPVHQKESPQIKYDHLSFYGHLQDDLDNNYEYEFSGAYYYFDGMLRIVDATLIMGQVLSPTVSQLELQNIIEFDIRSELRLSLRESIIFESKIELK